MLSKYKKLVVQINDQAAQMQPLSDVELSAKTEEFKARLAAGATLDSLIPEAFAVVREAGVRVMGMRHYDVQLVGALVLHDGNIAEMRTGEVRLWSLLWQSI